VPFFDHLISHTSFSAAHKVATPLFESDPLTVMLVGFEPGQSVPEHAGPAGAFYVLDGRGWISIAGERQVVRPGMVAIAPEGADRSIEAETRMTILASRGRHNVS
jgi:quercetin dioxygenase-like cupin family protein